MAVSRSVFPRYFHSYFRSPKVTSSQPLLLLPSTAFFSTHFVGDNPMLVRDFIHAALYDPNHGYFSQRSGSVGVLERSIKFNKLEAIMRTANLSVPLKIYEIGGGSGTCAKGIMDYIKLNAPTRVYNNMTYISVEISSSLAKKQIETVGKVQSHLSKFRVECRDAADPSGWGEVYQQPCWVIMLEVLDNLPHDLIYCENQVSPRMEVWVERHQER